MNDQPPPSSMTDTERDAAYTQLCRILTDVGEAQASLLLARLALLLMEQLGNAAVFGQLVDEAAKDLLPGD